MLKLTHLSKYFMKDSYVLSDISLSLEKGDRVVVFGSSGCGKSVLLRIIAGLLLPSSGSIECNMRCGMLFQASGLFDSMTIRQNISFPGHISDVQLEHVLNVVGLDSNVASKYPGEISGGMKKRVALARMIISGAELMLFDEPTAGLDPIGANSLSKVIQSINCTSITITHDIINAHIMGTKFILLYNKCILWQGMQSDLKDVQNAYVRQFFLLDSLTVR